ncbi:MAG: hypothetical protein JO257_21480 [Deltaproteobacteria bacterium]|nr:hypothetical protein [Deltaproteobacteria bacterium]
MHVAPLQHVLRAINLPSEPPEPRLPDNWPKPPPLPEPPPLEPVTPPAPEPPAPIQPLPIERAA